MSIGLWAGIGLKTREAERRGVYWQRIGLDEMGKGYSDGVGVNVDFRGCALYAT
jgi:hypothetical protein